MQSKRLDQSEVVRYWELLWGERYKLGQPLRGHPKVKGPDGNVYNLYVDTQVFNDSLSVLHNHYKPKAIKMLKRLVYRNKLRDMIAKVWPTIVSILHSCAITHRFTQRIPRVVFILTC